MSGPHDVTIFPLYDEHSARLPRFVGCLDPNNAVSAELPAGTFIAAIEKGQASGEIDLEPGHYLLLEFNEDIEEFIGMVFKINASGEVTSGIGGSSTPNLSTWPPKHHV